MQGGTFGFIHDILVTQNYYIVLENPISMNFGKLLTKYMLGKACLAECLEFDAERPTRVHLIPRPGCAPSNGDALFSWTMDVSRRSLCEPHQLMSLCLQDCLPCLKSQRRCSKKIPPADISELLEKKTVHHIGCPVGPVISEAAPSGVQAQQCRTEPLRRTPSSHSTT